MEATRYAGVEYANTSVDSVAIRTTEGERYGSTAETHVLQAIYLSSVAMRYSVCEVRSHATHQSYNALSEQVRRPPP